MLERLDLVYANLLEDIELDSGISVLIPKLIS